MNLCDAKGCYVECKEGCKKNTECICTHGTLMKMIYTKVSDIKIFESRDGVLTYCRIHREPAGYLSRLIKLLEHNHTNDTLYNLSYGYVELIIRLRKLFQFIFAHKRDIESSTGHRKRIIYLQKIVKILKKMYKNRPLNTNIIGDHEHLIHVNNILTLGYVKIRFNVYNMMSIQEDTENKCITTSIHSHSQWNNPLRILKN